MTELEKATAFISATLGAEATEIAELLQSDDATTQLTTRMADKLKATQDQADKRVLSKTASAVEKVFKDAGIPDAKYSDLPAAIDALKLKAADDAGKGLTPEQALKHPAVVQKLNEVTASIDQKVSAARQEEKQALATERANFSKAQLKAKAQATAEALVTELNPNFGDDPKKAATRKQELVERIASGDVVEVNGELFEATADGEVKPDALGNPVKYADLVRQRTEAAYDLPVAQKRDQVPTGTPAGAAAAFQHFKGEAPKTEAEVTAIRADQSIPLAARQEVKAYWEGRNPTP